MEGRGTPLLALALEAVGLGQQIPYKPPPSLRRGADSGLELGGSGENLKLFHQHPSGWLHLPVIALGGFGAHL